MDSETHRSTVAFRLQAPIQEIVAGTGVKARQLAREKQKNVAPAGVMARELFWDIAPEPDYAYMDQRVIDCLSDVLCAFGSFAFISDEPDVNECIALRLKARLWPSRSPIIQKDKNFYRRLHLSKVRSGALWLVETVRADVAQGFFRIQAWHYARCQAGYLRAAGSPALNLSDREIQDVIVDGSWDVMQHSLHASGSKAVCIPGHDGAWLKFVFLNAQTMHEFSKQLHACCAARQAACVIGA